MKDNKSIHGIIIPSTWDNNGNVILIAIVTFDEKKYLVADTATAQRLKLHLKKTVFAEGIVTEKGKELIIEVKKFKMER